MQDTARITSVTENADGQTVTVSVQATISGVPYVIPDFVCSKIPSTIVSMAQNQAEQFKQQFLDAQQATNNSIPTLQSMVGTSFNI